jgi:hypothetical protein
MCTSTTLAWPLVEPIDISLGDAPGACVYLTTVPDGNGPNVAPPVNTNTSVPHVRADQVKAILVLPSIRTRQCSGARRRDVLSVRVTDSSQNGICAAAEPGSTAKAAMTPRREVRRSRTDAWRRVNAGLRRRAAPRGSAGCSAFTRHCGSSRSPSAFLCVSSVWKQSGRWTRRPLDAGAAAAGAATRLVIG